MDYLQGQANKAAKAAVGQHAAEKSQLHQQLNDAADEHAKLKQAFGVLGKIHVAEQVRVEAAGLGKQVRQRLCCQQVTTGHCLQSASWQQTVVHACQVCKCV